MKAGSIPSKWIALSSTYRLDPQFWLTVLERVDAALIPHTDLARVATVVKTVERELQSGA